MCTSVLFSMIYAMLLCLGTYGRLLCISVSLMLQYGGVASIQELQIILILFLCACWHDTYGFVLWAQLSGARNWHGTTYRGRRIFVFWKPEIRMPRYKWRMMRVKLASGCQNDVGAPHTRIFTGFWSSCVLYRERSISKVV